jgi:hypothetical protein
MQERNAAFESGLPLSVGTPELWPRHFIMRSFRAHRSFPKSMRADVQANYNVWLPTQLQNTMVTDMIKQVAETYHVTPVESMFAL